MKFTDILKTIGFSIVYLTAGGIVYLLLMFLFAWMSHWWWFFIILIGMGGISSIIGFSQLISAAIVPLSRNWLGKILTILITIYLLYFSIHAVWTTDFLAEHAKEITVKIIATIVFSSTFLPAIIGVLSFNFKEDLQ